MDKFSCCSSYKQCSDAGKCLHLTDPQYAGCSYKSNLNAGKNFYSVTVKVPKKNIYEERSVFLNCFNRLYGIYGRQKSGLSAYLNDEQADKLEFNFEKLYIPYRTCIDSMDECIIDYPTVEDPTPANSRVVFEIDGELFHVLNYNSWLIKKRYAELIAKAFDNNYIKAWVELRGTYSYVNKVNLDDNKSRAVHKTQPVIINSSVNQHETAIQSNTIQEKFSANFKQMTIFELIQ